MVNIQSEKHKTGEIGVRVRSLFSPVLSAAAATAAGRIVGGLGNLISAGRNLDTQGKQNLSNCSVRVSELVVWEPTTYLS